MINSSNQGTSLFCTMIMVMKDGFCDIDTLVKFKETARFQVCQYTTILVKFPYMPSPKSVNKHKDASSIFKASLYDTKSSINSILYVCFRSPGISWQPDQHQDGLCPCFLVTLLSLSDVDFFGSVRHYGGMSRVLSQGSPEWHFPLRLWIHYTAKKNSQPASGTIRSEDGSLHYQ